MSEPFEDLMRNIVRSEVEAVVGSGAGVPREWLTVAEAAQHARCSESTMYARIKEGIVPSHRFEGRILISRTELDEAIRSQPSAAGRAVA